MVITVVRGFSLPLCELILLHVFFFFLKFWKKMVVIPVFCVIISKGKGAFTIH